MTTQRNYLKGMELGSAAPGLPPGSATSATPAKKPNVVFVLTDDQGYGDLHCPRQPLHQDPVHGQLGHWECEFHGLSRHDLMRILPRYVDDGALPYAHRVFGAQSARHLA